MYERMGSNGIWWDLAGNWWDLVGNSTAYSIFATVMKRDESKPPSVAPNLTCMRTQV